ncbi:MAG: DUF2380 domain-containing protein [Elusimicrobia bacterium]|nr:DUF2380 domain-containing protein [Elusimicrobiota bacterium]
MNSQLLIRYKAFLISLILIFLSCNLYAEKRINIAVAEFSGKNVSAMDASTVSDLLRTELVKTQKFNVVNRANMEQILAEQSLQMSGCTTQECAVRIGKLLNAQRVIVGSLMKLGTLYIINANMVDIETGEIVKSAKVNAQSIEELPEQSEYLARILAGDVEIKGRKTKKENNFGIGLNYPGTSIKAFLGNSFCLEPKYQFEDDIQVYGIRSNFYLNRDWMCLFFVGFELDYVAFEGEVSEGVGGAGQLFGGIECFVSKHLSVQIDLGPVFVMLDDDNSDASVSGTDIGGNVGVYYYFK